MIQERQFDSTDTLIGATSYVWGLDLAHSTGTGPSAGGVGGLLAVEDLATEEIYSPYFDGNGNIVGYVRLSDETIVAEYEYNAFGETLWKGGTLAEDFNIRFSTKYEDEESGLLYYGFRYYDPEKGRWLSRDPIGEEGGVNLYGFVGNDGVNAWDLLGLEIKIEFKENYSAARRSGSKARGWVYPPLNNVKVSCKSGKLKVAGDFKVSLNVLPLSDNRFNLRYSRYDRKYGTPRSDAQERQATIDHEFDHFNTYKTLSLAAKVLNGKEDDCCTAKLAQCLQSWYDAVYKEARAHSKTFDTTAWWGGGMYSSNRFIPKTTLNCK